MPIACAIKKERIANTFRHSPCLEDSPTKRLGNFNWDWRKIIIAF
jgi:hypothetical protein